MWRSFIRIQLCLDSSTSLGLVMASRSIKSPRYRVVEGLHGRHHAGHGTLEIHQLLPEHAIFSLQSLYALTFRPLVCLDPAL